MITKAAANTPIAIQSKGATSPIDVEGLSAPINAPTKNGVRVPDRELSDPLIADQLVAFVATAAEKVEHGVYNGVEHADAETADKCAKEIDEEIERNCKSLHCCVALSGHDVGGHLEKSDIGANDARKPLNEETDHSDSHCPKSCLFISYFHEQVA